MNYLKIISFFEYIFRHIECVYKNKQQLQATKNSKGNKNRPGKTRGSHLNLWKYYFFLLLCILIEYHESNKSKHHFETFHQIVNSWLGTWNTKKKKKIEWAMAKRIEFFFIDRHDVRCLFVLFVYTSYKFYLYHFR